MCNCLFCGQEMEDEEKLVDFHVCPPDQNISLNSVRVAMNEIFENEEDGWSAWASLADWLDKQSAQQGVQSDLPVCACVFQVAHDTLLVDPNCPVHGSASR